MTINVYIDTQDNEQSKKIHIKQSQWIDTGSVMVSACQSFAKPDVTIVMILFILFRIRFKHTKFSCI